MMLNKNKEKVSRLLSKALRHDPGCIGIELDKEGWTDVNFLIKSLQSFGLTFLDLKQIVSENDKQRFAFNDTYTKIRASQGHSIREVEISYVEQTPPTVLYHGTATRFFDSIKKTGITKQSRNHVHLSEDVKVAEKVGKRHGKCLILKIDAIVMYLHGYKFFKSANGVWLTETVPPQYIKVHKYVEDKYFIHNGSYVGNAMLWWAEGDSGYTTDLNKAQQYDLDGAKLRCKDGKHIAYNVDYILNRVSKTVDMQNISPSEALK